jgi:thiamine-monophosphate kinase
MTIDSDRLPIDETTRTFFVSHGLDPIEEAIAGGDDYELLFAVRPRLRRRLDAALRHGGVPLTRIGTCTEDRAVILRRDSSGADARVLPRRAYSHFHAPLDERRRNAT